MLLAAVLPLSVASARPAAMGAPTAAQRTLLMRLLGDDFVLANDTAFPARVEIAVVNLNNDRQPDYIATQRGYCSNHSCTYEIILSGKLGYRIVSHLDSWRPIEIASALHVRVHDLIVHEHTTDDCMACSPPTPLRYIWDDQTYTADGEKGTYVLTNGTNGKNHR